MKKIVTSLLISGVVMSGFANILVPAKLETGIVLDKANKQSILATFKKGSDDCNSLGNIDNIESKKAIIHFYVANCGNKYYTFGGLFFDDEKMLGAKINPEKDNKDYINIGNLDKTTNDINKVQKENFTIAPQEGYINLTDFEIKKK